MFSVRSILCPIDLSACSGHALRRAVSIAALHGADVTVAAVRPSNTAALGADRAAARRAPEEAGPTTWEESVWSFVHEVAGATCVRVLPAAGAVAPAILDAARHVHADLIVMCTPGTNELERLRPGSVTERVIGGAACPVLTIPGPDSWDGEPERRWRTILCGLDRWPAARQALDDAVLLAEMSRSRLIVVHVLDDLAPPARGSRLTGPPAAELEMRAACEALIPASLRARCDVRILIAHGKPQEELLRLSEEWRADLLVVGRSAERAQSGCVRDQVLCRARCAVLSVPPPAEVVRDSYLAIVDTVA